MCYWKCFECTKVRDCHSKIGQKMLSWWDLHNEANSALDPYLDRRSTNLLQRPPHVKAICKETAHIKTEKTSGIHKWSTPCPPFTLHLAILNFTARSPQDLVCGPLNPTRIILPFLCTPSYTHMRWSLKKQALTEPSSSLRPVSYLHLPGYPITIHTVQQQQHFHQHPPTSILLSYPGDISGGVLSPLLQICHH